MTMRPMLQLLLRLSSLGNRYIVIHLCDALQSTAHADGVCLGRWVKILHEILFFKTVLKAKKPPLGLPKSQGKAKQAKRTKKGHVPTLFFGPAPNTLKGGPSRGTTFSMRPPPSILQPHLSQNEETRTSCYLWMALGPRQAR